MKRAAASDARRRVHLRTAKNCPIIEKIEVKNLSGFSDTIFEPKSGLFVICGGTGVGKSTLLELISTALQPYRSGKRPRLRSRFGKPSIEIIIDNGSSRYCRQMNVLLPDSENSDGFQPEHRLVSLSERTEVLYGIFEEIDPKVAI